LKKFNKIGEEQDENNSIQEAENEIENQDDLVQNEQTGKIENIKENNLQKEIIQSGQGKYKPLEIDIVIASIKCFLPSGKAVKYFTFENREFSLEGRNIPKALKLAITSMRKNEFSKFFIKGNYIFKHFVNNCIPFPSPIESADLRNAISKEKITFEIHLLNFFVIQNLMENGEIKKKTLKEGFGSTAKLTNKIEFSLFCKFKDQELYSRNNEKLFLDDNQKEFIENENEKTKLTIYKLFDVERRILQAMSLNESAYITVKPSYMLEKCKDFLDVYGIDYIKPLNYDEEVKRIASMPAKTAQDTLIQQRETFELFNNNSKNDLIFECEIHSIERYEYIFKPDKDSFSKKLVVNKGFGKDSPDRESYAHLDLLIKIDGEIVFNSFKNENLENLNNKTTENLAEIVDNPFEFAEIFQIKKLNQEIKLFRSQLNEKYNIELDMDLEFERDLKVFNEVENRFPAALKIDLRIYSIPIILRKVLIHMKRGELAYIKTGYIDCFGQCEREIADKTGKIEIYVLLYDFLHRKLFSKLSLEDKYEDLIQLKDLANSFFKSGKLFRASKIYQNINYRFNFGDVFGMIFEENEIPIMEKNPVVYKKLNDIRISCHNNLASAKLKLGKFYSAYSTADKVIIF